jgi:urease accessory protein
MTTSPSRLQRASGESRVAFDLRDGRRGLGDLYQRDPCRVLFP